MSDQRQTITPTEIACMPVIPSVHEVVVRFERLRAMVGEDETALADLAAIHDVITALCVGVVEIDGGLERAYVDGACYGYSGDESGCGETRTKQFRRRARTHLAQVSARHQ